MIVFNDMKTRGCNAVLIAVTDGLKGMGKALASGLCILEGQKAFGHSHQADLHRAQRRGG